MNGPGTIDTSSPFFSSLAAQHTQTKTKTKEEKIKSKKISFDAALKQEAKLLSTNAEFLPKHLQNLPKEKIVEALLDEVHSCGDALKDRQMPDTILDYKNAIKTFIQYVVNQSYEVYENTSGGNILKRKKFTQIQIIDQKLEQMAAEILGNQKKQMNILAKIEEINGLLVDLLS